jgi:hypothetical protein
MRCTSCDHLNPADAHFCTGCGATFAATATTRLPAAPEPAAPPAPLLATPPAPLAAAAAPVPALNQTINVTVQAAAPAPAPAATPVIVLAQQATGPGCLVRTLYFCAIGLWFGALWTGVAWFLLISIIGLPFGIMMLNRIPQVMTLRPVRTQTQVSTSGGVVVVSQGNVAQHPFWLRTVYFIGVGWWFSGLWLGFAWALIGATLGLGLPIAFWMFDRTPAIVTLARQ